MKACKHPDPPELIKKYSSEICEEYVVRKKENPKYKFHWPSREGQNLGEIIRDSLRTAMNEGHCAYCDGWPIDAQGREEIDHFRPKSRQAFFHLVCEWQNLFLSCTACNSAKGEQWDDRLIRPDDDNYDFFRYFEYEAATGRLKPNQAASNVDKEAAEVTLRILDLCRDGACISRKNALRNFQQSLRDPEDERQSDDFPHRFLFPLLSE